MQVPWHKRDVILLALALSLVRAAPRVAHVGDLEEAVRAMIAKARRDQSLCMFAARVRTRYALQAALVLINDHDARQLLPWLTTNIGLGADSDGIGPEQVAAIGARFGRVLDDEGLQGPVQPSHVSALLHIFAFSTLCDPHARLYCGATSEVMSALCATLEQGKYEKALALMRALSRIVALVSGHESSVHDKASARTLSTRSASLVAASTAAVVRSIVLPLHSSLPSAFVLLRERIRHLEGNEYEVYCLKLAAAAEEVTDEIIRALTLCAHNDTFTEPQPARRGAPQLPQ